MFVLNNKSNLFVFIVNINKSNFVPIINVGCNQHDFRVVISHFLGHFYLQKFRNYVFFQQRSYTFALNLGFRDN